MGLLDVFALASTAAQMGAIVTLAILLSRTRERLVKLEEWARLAEKRLNGLA